MNALYLTTINFIGLCFYPSLPKVLAAVGEHMALQLRKPSLQSFEEQHPRRVVVGKHVERPSPTLP